MYDAQHLSEAKNDLLYTVQKTLDESARVSL